MRVVNDISLLWRHYDILGHHIEKKMIVQLSLVMVSLNIFSRLILTLGTNSEGHGQMLSQYRYLLPPRSSILLQSLKNIHEKLWVI